MVAISFVSFFFWLDAWYSPWQFEPIYWRMRGAGSLHCYAVLLKRKSAGVLKGILQKLWVHFLANWSAKISHHVFSSTQKWGSNLTQLSRFPALRVGCFNLLFAYDLAHLIFYVGCRWPSFWVAAIWKISDTQVKLMTCYTNLSHSWQREAVIVAIFWCLFLESRETFGHISGDNCLCIFKAKAFRGTELCS